MSVGYVIVNGVIQMNQPVTITDPLVLADAGTVGAPAFSFTGETNSGMYLAGAGIIGIACAGQVGLLVSSTSITAPKLIGGSGVASTLTFQTTSGVGAPGADFVWLNGNNGASEQMRLFQSTGGLSIGTNLAAALGSGGNHFLNLHGTGGSNSGINISTDVTTDGFVVGYLDMGTRGTAGAEKRAAAIQAALVGSAAAAVTSTLIFYTTAAGTIAESMRLTTGALRIPAGSLLYWNGRALFGSSADGVLQLGPNSGTTGVSFDTNTNGTLLVKNFANNANGQLAAASVRGAAVAFASLPATPVEGMIAAVTNSSTVVWGANADGAGANHVLVYYNGTNWTVIGK